MGIMEISLYAALAAFVVYISVHCLSVFFKAFTGIFNFVISITNGIQKMCIRLKGKISKKRRG